MATHIRSYLLLVTLALGVSKLASGQVTEFNRPCQSDNDCPAGWVCSLHCVVKDWNTEGDKALPRAGKPAEADVLEVVAPPPVPERAPEEPVPPSRTKGRTKQPPASVDQGVPLEFRTGGDECSTSLAPATTSPRRVIFSDGPLPDLIDTLDKTAAQKRIVIDWKSLEIVYYPEATSASHTPASKPTVLKLGEDCPYGLGQWLAGLTPKKRLKGCGKNHTAARLTNLRAVGAGFDVVCGGNDPLTLATR